MPDPISFDLPADDDATAQRGAPLSIRHGCDYDLAAGYSYNYLDYHWRVGDTDVTARAYLDEIDSIAFTRSAADLARVGIDDILAFLQRRFTSIRTLEADGYTTTWQRARPASSQ
jgi:hypothetical protein